MIVNNPNLSFPFSNEKSREHALVAAGVRLWARLIARVKAARQARAEHELLALAAQYEQSMPSFAADLRAAHGRKA